MLGTFASLCLAYASNSQNSRGMLCLGVTVASQTLTEPSVWPMPPNSQNSRGMLCLGVTVASQTSTEGCVWPLLPDDYSNRGISWWIMTWTKGAYLWSYGVIKAEISAQYQRISNHFLYRRHIDFCSVFNCYFSEI